MSIYTNSNFVTEIMTRFRGSFFHNILSPKAFACSLTDTIGEFEELLEEAFQERYAKKEDNFLISPSAFVHKDNIKEERGLENVVFASGIFLDFDGGDLKPSKLSQIFPQLRMKIYSSFNSTKAPLRFRVYIPSFTQPSINFAERHPSKIVLIDGKMLTSLMIRYNVGARIDETLYLKKIDEDFFIDE